MYRTLTLAVLLLVSACAPREIATHTAPAPPPTPVIDTETLIRAGCYRCLESAFAAAQASPQSAFQVAALLALRSKELGLPHGPWVARASEWLPPGDEWPLYLEIVNIVRIDPLSGDREEILNLTTAQRRPAATVELWREALKTGDASPLFRAYLGSDTGL